MNTFKRIDNLENFTTVWVISVNGESCELDEYLVGMEHLQTRTCLINGWCTIWPPSRSYFPNCLSRGEIPFLLLRFDSQPSLDPNHREAGPGIPNYVSVASCATWTAVGKVK
jgi:hypothetical protein